MEWVERHQIMYLMWNRRFGLSCFYSHDIFSHKFCCSKYDNTFMDDFIRFSPGSLQHSMFLAKIKVQSKSGPHPKNLRLGSYYYPKIFQKYLKVLGKIDIFQNFPKYFFFNRLPGFQHGKHWFYPEIRNIFQILLDVTVIELVTPLFTPWYTDYKRMMNPSQKYGLICFAIKFIMRLNYENNDIMKITAN